MNEVKELCRRALDGPEPPLRDAGEILSIARRTTRTRDLRRAGFGLAAVAALAAGGALLAPEAIVADPPPPAPPEAAASPTPPPAPTAPAPTVAEAVDHIPRIVDLVTNALPAGHTAAPLDRAAPPWYAELADDSYVVVAVVPVSSETGTGGLQVVIRGDRSGPAGDVCEPEIRAGFAAPADAVCRLVVGDSGPIWTITGRDAAGGEVRAATRLLDGGYLTVVAQQAVEGSDSPPLARVPLSASDLAALMADPAILP